MPCCGSARWMQISGGPGTERRIFSRKEHGLPAPEAVLLLLLSCLIENMHSFKQVGICEQVFDRLHSLA